MAIAYTTNTLVWLTDSKKWKLTMEVNASVQKGVSLWPFVVEKFISEEDLLDGSSVATKEVIIDRLTGEAGGSYPYPLFRRVSLQEDLKTIDTVDVLAGVLKAKQESRRLEYSDENGALPDDSSETFNSLAPGQPSATAHKDYIPVVGYHLFRVKKIVATFPNYDLAAAVQKANDLYLRTYAGEFLEDSNAQYLPLSAGIASTYPGRNFTPGSTSATGLIAGDDVFLNISGGSGDYDITIDASLEQLSPRRYRVKVDDTTTSSIGITDSITNEVITISLGIVKKGA